MSIRVRNTTHFCGFLPLMYDGVKVGNASMNSDGTCVIVFDNEEVRNELIENCTLSFSMEMERIEKE